MLAVAILVSFAGCSKSNDPKEEPLTNRVYMPTDLVAKAGDHFTVPVYFENEVPIGCVSVPLSFPVESVQCDSVSFIGSRAVGFFMKQYYISHDTIQFTVVDTAGVSAGRGLLATLYFWAHGNAPEFDMVLDTISHPTLPFGFSDTSLSQIPIRPQFVRGKVHIQTQLP
jgi:hypothetical protein